MKILYYSPHPLLNLQAPTGYGTHIREMLNAFEEQGNKVLPFITGGTELKNTIDYSHKSRIKKLIKTFVPSIIWESLKDRNLLRFDSHLKNKLEQVVSEFQPDLIYERGNYLQTSGVAIAKKMNVKHILEINAPFNEEKISMEGKSLYSKKANQIEKEQLLLTDRIVVVSSALKNYFIEKHNIPSEKFIITPNAINPKKISVNPLEKDEIKKKHQIKNEFLIGFVGSVFPYHGVDILIESFSKIYMGCRNAKLLIVGNGMILQELKNLTEKLNISDKIIFTGNIKHEDVFNYIDLMDICVMPKSNWYGSPVKIFEYGAMNKAIIAPDVIPVRDVMEHEKDGLLILPDVDKLTQALHLLLNDEPLRRLIAKNFQEKVLHTYTWSNNAENILKYIEN